MRPKAEEQRDTSNPGYPGTPEGERPGVSGLTDSALARGYSLQSLPRPGVGDMLPYYQDGTLFSEAGTWGWREVAVVWLIAAAGLACIWFA